MSGYFHFFIIMFLFVSVKSQQITFSKVATSYTFYSVVQANDSSYVIAGTGDSSYNDDGLILGIDSAGEYKWAKKIGGSGSDVFFSITSTSDSGFILCGYTNTPQFTSGNADMFIVKVDASGDTLWSRAFGGTGDDAAYSCQQTNDKGYVVAGNLGGDICVLKLDSSGNLMWNKNFNAGGNEQCNVIKQTPDSGYALIGSTSSFSSYDETFFIKLTSSGSILWSKRYNNGSYCYGNDFEFTNTGIVCYASSYTSSIIMKIDYSGNLLWSKSYDFQWMPGGMYLPPPPPKMCLAKDSNFVFINANQMGPGAFILKTDSAGTLMWFSALVLFNHDIIPTQDTGYLIVGEGPLAWGVKTLNPNIEGGVIKTDSAGNVMNWCFWWSQTTYSSPSLMAFNAPFTVTTGGIFKIIHPVVSNPNIFYSDGCVSIIGAVQEDNLEQIIFISPNPCTSKLTIEFLSSESNIDNISLYNIFGQQLVNVQNITPKTELNLSPFASGIYFVRIISDDGRIFSQKIIKE